MPRVAADEFWEDFYWSHGAYAMVSNGLYRSPQQIASGMMHHVFPSLHSIHNEYVTDKLTKIIRDNLPSNIPESVRDQFAATSLRKGSINEIALHKDIGPFEACARSGHAIANTDYYMDPFNPLRSLPAAQALHVRSIVT